MRILFMGTPEYAIPTLVRLISEHEVIGVVTRADKPSGRGHKLTPSPVKVCAMDHNIPVFQPEDMKDPALYEVLAALKPDISVVVAYGKFIPDSIIAIPRLNTINIHGSLLPKYRGAAPMQYSVLNGDAEAGVSIMYVTSGLDCGDVILQKAIPIGENETFGELHDRLAVLGRDTLSEALDLLESGAAKPFKQDGALSSYASMITKEECNIDWSRPASEVHNRIRGLSPNPGAFTKSPSGKIIKLYRSEVAEGSGRPGEIIAAIKKKGFVVACGAGAVCIVSAKPEGKREMPAIELINGHYIGIGDVLSP
ncbi:MAG TPA: methionyl-tRNA formyltransferase [Methanocorpusculum sp.]|nr:methionyl-tRNA formyltransferase [Methanocorpusculum sp.]